MHQSGCANYINSVMAGVFWCDVPLKIVQLWQSPQGFREMGFAGAGDGLKMMEDDLTDDDYFADKTFEFMRCLLSGILRILSVYNNCFPGRLFELISDTPGTVTASLRYLEEFWYPLQGFEANAQLRGGRWSRFYSGFLAPRLVYFREILIELAEVSFRGVPYYVHENISKLAHLWLSTHVAELALHTLRDAERASPSKAVGGCNDIINCINPAFSMTKADESFQSARRRRRRHSRRCHPGSSRENQKVFPWAPSCWMP